jgi:hypothetical protein
MVAINSMSFKFKLTMKFADYMPAKALLRARPCSPCTYHVLVSVTSLVLYVTPRQPEDRE